MAVSNSTINHNAPNTQIIIQTEQHLIITGVMHRTVITNYQRLSQHVQFSHALHVCVSFSSSWTLTLKHNNNKQALFP